MKFIAKFMTLLFLGLNVAEANAQKSIFSDFKNKRYPEQNLDLLNKQEEQAQDKITKKSEDNVFDFDFGQEEVNIQDALKLSDENYADETRASSAKFKQNHIKKVNSKDTYADLSEIKPSDSAEVNKKTASKKKEQIKKLKANSKKLTEKKFQEQPATVKLKKPEQLKPEANNDIVSQVTKEVKIDLKPAANNSQAQNSEITQQMQQTPIAPNKQEVSNSASVSAGALPQISQAPTIQAPVLASQPPAPPALSANAKPILNNKDEEEKNKIKPNNGLDSGIPPAPIMPPMVN